MNAVEIPKFSYKRLCKNLTVLALSLLLVCILVHKGHVTVQKLADWDDYLPLIALAMLVQMLVTVFSAFRWQWLARHQNETLNNIPMLYAWHHLSQAFGLLTLGGLGADALRWYYMSSLNHIPKKKSLLITFNDRFLSLAVLGFAIVALRFYTYQLYLAFALLVVACVFAAHYYKMMKICFVSIVNHVVRLALFLYALKIINPAFQFHLEDISNISFGLIAEILPISFEGIGATHWVFDHYFQSSGIIAIQVLIIAKIFYRIAGLIFLPIWFSYRKA